MIEPNPRSRRPIAIAAAVTVTVVAAAVAIIATRGEDDPTGASAADTTATTARETTTTVAAAGGPASTNPPATGGALPTRADGRFLIVGKDIVSPDGNVFVPMGANVAVRQGPWEEGYAFNWNGTATGRSDDVLAWGWNTVRATLVCNLDGSGPNVDELNAGIDAFIEEYTAKRIVVMVECHDITGDNLGPDAPQVAALYEFWDRLAERWNDNPYVWFNTFNEPQGTADRAGVDNWLALQRDALDRLRAVAPDSVFVADIPGSAQAVDQFAAEEPLTRLGDGQCNVLYGWHAYGAVGKNGVFGDEADYGDEAASLANHREAFTYLSENDIPVVIGEFGDPLTLEEGNAGQPIWNRLGARSVIELAPEFGYGLLWWHGTGDSGIFLTYSLMADREAAPWSAATTGEGLSDGGRRFWEASQKRPAPVKFTGDLTASNCP